MTAVLDKPVAPRTGNQIRDKFVYDLAQFANRMGEMMPSVSNRYEIMMAYLASIYFYSGTSTVASIMDSFDIGIFGEPHGHWARLVRNSKASLLRDTHINMAIHGESVAERIRSYAPAIIYSDDGVSIDSKHNIPVYLNVLEGNAWKHLARHREGVRGFGTILVKRQPDLSGANVAKAVHVKRQDVVYVIEISELSGIPLSTLKVAFNHLNLSSQQITGAFLSYLTDNMSRYLTLDTESHVYQSLTYVDMLAYIDCLGFNDVPRELVVNHPASANMMSEVIGISPELICSPAGSSSERKETLIRRGIHDTIYNLAMRYLKQIWYELGVEGSIKLSV